MIAKDLPFQFRSLSHHCCIYLPLRMLDILELINSLEVLVKHPDGWHCEQLGVISTRIMAFPYYDPLFSLQPLQYTFLCCNYPIASGRAIKEYITQPAITCSKLTIETLEQGVKYVQS